MKKNYNEFCQSLKGKKVCFIGIGLSHMELIKQFLSFGAEVTALDRKDNEAFLELKQLGAKIITGQDYLEHIGDAELILRTPGLNFNHPAVVKARQHSAVTSEMELFFEFCDAKIIGITGSDGKSTTSTITAGLLKASGKRVHLGGNIGFPLLYRISEIAKDDYVVVELSSFQLMSMRVSPDIALITNITPNHLDVHSDMDEYVAAKHNVLLHQNPYSIAVLNEDNPLSISSKKLVRGRLRTFSLENEVENGVWLDKNNDILYKCGGNIQKVLNASDIKLVGRHNISNFMAAISMLADEIDLSIVQSYAREFSGVAHRFEFVRELDGVKWYNDAIASSPTRTIAGLNSCGGEILLIAGGYDKKIPFDELGDVICQKVDTVILMGDTAKKIEDAVVNSPYYHKDLPTILLVKNMEEAVTTARKYAKKGGLVTLSPACASFDMYKNFEKKGEDFKRLVNSLV